MTCRGRPLGSSVASAPKVAQIIRAMTTRLKVTTTHVPTAIHDVQLVNFIGNMNARRNGPERWASSVHEPTTIVPNESVHPHRVTKSYPSWSPRSPAHSAIDATRNAPPEIPPRKR